MTRVLKSRGYSSTMLQPQAIAARLRLARAKNISSKTFWQ